MLRRVQAQRLWQIARAIHHFRDGGSGHPINQKEPLEMKRELQKQSMRLISTSILLTCSTLLTGCGGGGGEGSTWDSSPAGQTGAMASLAWYPVQDPSVQGYYVYYGRNSAGQSGSCNYESKQFVSSPSATITNLDHETRYYFSVSAYNGLESGCSDEVSNIIEEPPV